LMLLYCRISGVEASDAIRRALSYA
jgi:hypothetical protein